MWEKAFRGDDGSQFSRKRSVRPCGLNSKGLSLCFFELNFTRMWGRKTEDKKELTVWALFALLNSKSFALRMISAKFIDILESRVMKRMSINHCADVDARANAQDWNTGLICRKGLGTSRADISGSGRQSCEPEFNSGYEKKHSANIHQTDSQCGSVFLLKSN